MSRNSTTKLTSRLPSSCSRGRRLGQVAAISLFIGLLLSCGDRPIGYGVLLWPPNPEYLPAGSILTLMSESNITNSYWARYTPQDPALEEASPELVQAEGEFDRFRVRRFETREQAISFSQEYRAGFAETYVRVQRDAVPIRRIMDRSSERIYRLREGEVLKVIDKSPEPTNEAGLVSHWYRVIAEDGTSGWSFGYYLTEYELGQDPGEQNAHEGEYFAAFLMQTWRPRYFAEMIRTGRYDFSRFHPSFGLFPQPEQRSIRIISPEGSTELSYSGLQPVSETRFIDQSTGLELEFEDMQSITVRYERNGARVTARFVVIEDDIRGRIADEQTRRLAVYDELYQVAGGRMTSLAFGDIEIQRDRSFFWRNNDRLRPEVIPNLAGNTGRIDLGRYLHASLRTQFDGALAFDFNGTDEDVSFLYRVTGTGLQLTHVPNALLDGVTVSAVPQLPLVIFFAFGDTPPAEHSTEQADTESHSSEDDGAE